MDERTTWEGTIHSIIFQNQENGYTVFRLINLEGEVITAVGCVPCAAPGEHLSITGDWETHPQHGRQLRVRELERGMPEDEDEILGYLASGVIKGVGQATAQRIVERFGAESLEVLEHAPERLTALKGITARRAQEIAQSFRQHMGLRRLMDFLTRWELPPVLSMQLRRLYGDAALERITGNPYLLSSDECGVAFETTDRIAMTMGMDPEGAPRLQAGVIYELSYNEHRGHVFLPREKLLIATCQMVHCETGLVNQAIEALLERGEVVQERTAGVDACYLRRLWAAETSACKRLNALLAAEADRLPQADQILQEIEEAAGITYAPQQRQAVRQAAESGVLILTGGPGTGKTTTVRGIVALFRRMGLDMVLAAPTGRAAKRMSELTGMEAQTIHRLLGQTWRDGEVTFQKSEREPLEANAVIVDEMSMVDLELFSALLRALQPGTRLVLVGDADQLPSVGAGNVFSDLIRSGRVETVLLREVFRQAEQSAIIRNAHTVNRGQSLDLSVNQGDMFFLPRQDAKQAASTLVELCGTRLPGKMGVPADQIQVLTPTRKGPTGTRNLNRLLQEALNPRSPGKREIFWGEAVIREGDRIMQTRNDYDVLWEKEDGSAGTGMFNGDVGRVVKIDPAAQVLELDFDGRHAVYTMDMLNEVELAYAMTIHKAQGSEYRCVVLAMMPGPQALMVRGVLYTALTRARELLVMVGDTATIRAVAANDRRQKRYSGLRWRLAHSGEAGADA